MKSDSEGVPKKRARIVKTRPVKTPTEPRKAGKLRMLPEMPLDILFEVFSYLEPLDIMRLSRSTKDLRNILMSRSAVTIWRAALKNDPDFPPLPEDLNEPQFVNLLCSEHCHYCLSTTGPRHALWVNRARSCQTCLHRSFGHLSNLNGKSLIAMNSNLLLSEFVVIHGMATSCFSREDARILKGDLIRLGADPAGLERYREQKLKFIADRREHAARYMSYPILHAARVRQALEETRRKRREEILRRLSNMGYEEEINYLDEIDASSLRDHPLLNLPKDLTDRLWTNMKPTLIELMEETRVKLIRKKRKALFKKRLHVLTTLFSEYTDPLRASRKIMPGPADLCMVPQVKAMLEDEDLEAYTEADSFVELESELPRLCEEWRQSKKRDLLALISTGNAVCKLRAEKGDYACLALATTYFQCSGCAEPIAYPRILAHSCLTVLRHGHRNREDDQALIFKNLQSEPWNVDGNRVVYHKQAEASAIAVIQTCGFTPTVATARNIDDADPWLECKRCRHPEHGRQVFRWRRAILHDLYHKTCDSGAASSWTLLDANDSVIAKRQEQHTYSRRGDNASDYICIRCNQRLSWPVLSDHIRDSHGITGRDLRSDDYCLYVDASMDQPPFRINIPLADFEASDQPQQIQHAPQPEVIDLSHDGDDLDALEYIDPPVVGNIDPPVVGNIDPPVVGNGSEDTPYELEYMDIPEDREVIVIDD